MFYKERHGLGFESVTSRLGFCLLKSEQCLLGLFILLEEDAAPDSKWCHRWSDVVKVDPWRANDLRAWHLLYTVKVLEDPEAGKGSDTSTALRASLEKMVPEPSLHGPRAIHRLHF